VKLIKRHWLIAVLILAVVFATAAFQLRGKDKVQYFTTKVDRGDIHDVVQATGTINAVTTVQVGSQVSGTISHLYADFNSRVKKGEVIAQIDPALFQATLLQSKADYANAKANLVAAKANLEKAQASALQTHTDYLRTVGLTKEGVMSQQQLDQAKASADANDAAVSAAAAAVTQASAQMQLKEAAVKLAQTNLDYTTIHAPIDGTVIARSVDVGQTVAASLQAPTLFTIAQDLTKMQVYVSTDESDVGMIRTGQPATFRVDAYPKDIFSGRISQVRLNATTVQNVVTYNTIVDFNNPDLKLFPGMTAYISIPVANATNVMRVPDGALRYKPNMTAAQVRALYQKYGLSSGNGTQQASKGSASGAPGQQHRPRAEGTEGGGSGNRNAQSGDMRAPRVDVAVIWKLLPDKSLEPVRVRTGITDHTITEVAQVLNGQLKPGDELVTGEVRAGAGPRLPGMR
jgi:HlyD family secretion protein